MLLFTRDKKRQIRSFILNLVNTHCVESCRFREGLRLDSRVNLSVALMVAPIERGRPNLDKAFATVTKDFSSTGMSLVLAEPLSLDEVILAFPRKATPTYARAKAQHLTPMGCGFFQLGLRLTEIVTEADYPEIEALMQRP